MPRKAISCNVVIHVQQITCPGTRHLADRNMLYVRATLLGDRKRTKSVFATFPVYLNERLYFERTFTNAREPSHVMEMLEDESVILELLQYSEIYKNGKCLARYEQSTREFLYPSPTLTGKDGLDREVLMSRTTNFTGIDPKLEFSTVTTIEETTVPGTYSELTTVHFSDESEDEDSASTEEEIVVMPPAKVTPSRISTAEGGKHCICECPKRPENRGKVVVRSRSLSPKFKKEKSVSQKKPPFKAGKADRSLISKRDFISSKRTSRAKERQPHLPRGQPLPCLDCELPHEDCIVCQAYQRVFGHDFLKHRFSTASGHHRSATAPVITSEPPRLRKTRIAASEDVSEDDDGLSESLAYSLPIPHPSSASAFLQDLNGSYLSSTKRESVRRPKSSPVKTVSYVDDEELSESDDDSLLSLQELRYEIDDARLESLDRSFEDPEHPTLGTRLDRSLRGY